MSGSPFFNPTQQANQAFWSASSTTASAQPKPISTPPVNEQKSEISFAHHFNSPAFTIYVGKNPHTRETFHLPRQLLVANSAYFATLLNGSFKGVEATDDAVTLDSEVDRVDGFKMFVDWLFLGDYTPPKTLLFTDQTCLLHVRVYVLAERLCADALKSLALKKMGAELHKAYRIEGAPFGILVPTIGLSSIVELIKAVYPYTSDVYPEDDDPKCHGGAGGESSVSGNSTSQAEMKGLVVPPEFPQEQVAGISATPSQRQRLAVLNERLARIEPPRVAAWPSLASTFSTPQLKRDPMRVLIARYAGSALDVLRYDSEFSKLMRGYYGCGEFANDLLLGVKKGDQLGLL